MLNPPRGERRVINSSGKGLFLLSAMGPEQSAAVRFCQMESMRSAHRLLTLCFLTLPGLWEEIWL